VVALLCLTLGVPLPAAAADYLRMRQVPIIDAEGFVRPVEAASILLPSDWQVVAGARWSADLACPQNAIQLTLVAESPDERLGVEVFPDYAWEWSEDPAVQQYAQLARQQYGTVTCELLPVTDAVDYLQRVFLPRWRADATLVDLGQVPELAQALNRELQAATGGNVGIVQNDIDVALATLETPGETGPQSEWVIVALLRTAMAMPAIGGGGWGSQPMAGYYKLAATSHFAARAPRGELEANEALFEAIWRSLRINPGWDAARADFLMTIDRIQRQGVRDRLAIMQRSRDETAAILQEVYEKRQAGIDQASEARSRALRGVGLYVDPATDRRVEVSSGFSHVWTDGNDYLLSNEAGFDPLRELGGSWRALQRE
jgi:hypothetical protein